VRFSRLNHLRQCQVYLFADRISSARYARPISFASPECHPLLIPLPDPSLWFVPFRLCTHMVPLWLHFSSLTLCVKAVVSPFRLPLCAFSRVLLPLFGTLPVFYSPLSDPPLFMFVAANGSAHIVIPGACFQVGLRQAFLCHVWLAFPLCPPFCDHPPLARRVLHVSLPRFFCVCHTTVVASADYSYTSRPP